jgi:hypothetical protein
MCFIMIRLQFVKWTFQWEVNEGIYATFRTLRPAIARHVVASHRRHFPASRLTGTQNACHRDALPRMNGGINVQANQICWFARLNLGMDKLTGQAGPTKQELEARVGAEIINPQVSFEMPGHFQGLLLESSFQKLEGLFLVAETRIDSRDHIG